MARILVIDDSRAIVTALREILEPSGHVVDSLDNFLDLPFKLRESPPQLVILDLNMPMMSGEMAAEYVRRYEERPTPILIYSSRPEEELAIAAGKTGASGFLRKGTPPTRLLERVQQVLAHHAP